MIPVSSPAATAALAAILAAAIFTPAHPAATGPRNSAVTTPKPLMLEKEEGERRIVRPYPGYPDAKETFILKIDPKNGGSSHLVFFTASIAAGGEIEAHRHPEADEILYMQSGTARVHLGEAVKDMDAGATIFIPANTWISVNNIGSDAVNLACIFSAPGFEDLMRAVSVREGEKNVPMSEAENADVLKKNTRAVIYKTP
jgi:quercetin dioxygenase-like cupin family protein